MSVVGFSPAREVEYTHIYLFMHIYEDESNENLKHVLSRISLDTKGTQ